MTPTDAFRRPSALRTTRCAVVLAASLAASAHALADAAEHGGGAVHERAATHEGAETRESAPYAGLQTRRVASLSAADLAQLEAGAGWGLALPAELNGHPGPAHVLELSDELGLTPGQRASVETMHARMKREAVAAGEALVAAERALDEGFRRGDLDEASLLDLVRRADDARGDLRYVHLVRHLRTVDVLSGTQIERYQRLRGYAVDPCDGTPDGHDPVMWRKHNGCDAGESR